ncbi:hypothetical protein GOP47_0001709 [Adiantum capillus-veneris]|uniref:Protein kinase domain-containing protein n=1 Tax=Adiantum capillus-veneris TaxID=13818 RepID=A0A9D4VA28_ADICA|nr:hypothetical protein GOP47_0001709 [Adiantum capillus-veneris]
MATHSPISSLYSHVLLLECRIRMVPKADVPFVPRVICHLNKRERKQVSRREEGYEARQDGASVHDSANDEEEQEEEKSRLVSCGVAGSADGLCYCKSPSSFGRLPSRAAMAAHMRSYCDVVKKKCTVSLRGHVMCLPFGFSVKEEKTSAEAIGVCLIELGIHIHASILLAHRRFSLKELRMATSHFAEENMLGKGSSGCVYKGELVTTGESIAVKLLNVRSKDARLSFSTELEVMYRVCNYHIQPLLGYCIESGSLLLVYTYMPRGSVEDLLHGAHNLPKLSWHDRCKVAVNIAKALLYLHTECNPPIIHRDIKPSNILLTTYNEAKLTDFGLAIKASSPYFICKDIMGSFGYLSPEYFQFGKVSTKMDIYSLGIVLLELMTGRCPIDNTGPPGQANLANWASHLVINARNFTVEMADPVLGDSYSSTEMQRLLYIAVLCIHPRDSCRPSISKVLHLMQEEPAVRLRCLVTDAYKDPSNTLNCHLSFPSMGEQDKSIGKSEEDLRKQYLEMALQDVERNSFLSSPLIDL